MDFFLHYSTLFFLDMCITARLTIQKCFVLNIKLVGTHSISLSLVYKKRQIKNCNKQQSQMKFNLLFICQPGSNMYKEIVFWFLSFSVFCEFASFLCSVIRVVYKTKTNPFPLYCSVVSVVYNFNFNFTSEQVNVVCLCAFCSCTKKNIH